MDSHPGIYWIQALDDGEWQNLHRCDSHDDAIAFMGPLLSDRRYREIRLVLAESRDGRIEYTTLVKTLDGEVVSTPSGDTLPPPVKLQPTRPVAGGSGRRLGAFAIVLLLAIAGGLAIAYENPRFAISLYDRAARLIAVETTPLAKPAETATNAAASKTEKPYSDLLFDAVDANNESRVRRLMAMRPGDLQLDELRIFVDDGWDTGPRKIVDYALLGGHLAAADALLSAGATPSVWLRGIMTRNAHLAKLKPAISLLNEFGAVPEISVEAAIEETKREFTGN